MVNSDGVSELTGLLLGSICILLRALRVMRQFEGLGDVCELEVSRKARGDVDEDFGVVLISQMNINYTVTQWYY